VTTDGMTCGRARRLLWPDAGPRAASPDVIDAQEHLAACTSCQAFIADMRAVGDATRESAPREQAPAEVRARLFAALAHARAGMQPRRRRHARNWLLVATAVVLITLGGTFLADGLTRHPSDDAIAALAEDHARAVGEAHIASTDPAEVETWVAAQVHFAMQVPVLPGATLRGARVSVFDGRRGAVVEYDVDGTRLSYFVVPNGPVTSDASSPMRFDRTARTGYHVVSWREPGLLHAMVGNLSASQLETFARACVEQAGRAVVWREDRTLSEEG
jgi:anti-sigma factor RsiW